MTVETVIDKEHLREEMLRCNTPRLRGQEVDGASAQTERYRGSWTPAKGLQIPPDVNTTQSIE